MTAITRLLKSYLQINTTPKYDRQTQALDRFVDAIDNTTVHPNRNTTQGIEAATPQEGSGVDIQMKDTDYDLVSGVSDDHLYYANQSGEDNSPELDNTVVARVRENRSVFTVMAQQSTKNLGLEEALPPITGIGWNITKDALRHESNYVKEGLDVATQGNSAVKTAYLMKKIKPAFRNMGLKISR